MYWEAVVRVGTRSAVLRQAQGEIGNVGMMGGCGFVRGALLLLVVGIMAGCGLGTEVAVETKVTIKSSPIEEAEVYIDGELRGLTPLTLTDLPIGSVDLLLKHEHYRRAFDRIEVVVGPPATFTIEMEPLVGFLTLLSTPPGATVRLENDEVLGETPIHKKPLPIGAYAYSLELENHYSVEDSFTVEEDFKYEFNHHLKPLEAELVVSSRPAGADIWINNQLQKTKAPSRFNLAPGLYLVSVHTQGYIQKDARVEIKPAATEQVTIVMDRGQVPAGMVLVPAGEFIRGAKERSPDEGPQLKLKLKGFYIDKYEVTNADFKKVFPSHEFNKGRDDFPVSGVSWEQAMAYASAVGKRLPTEAEWEKAARGTDGREYPWGKSFEDGLCNTKEHGLMAPVKVGELFIASSPYGCVGMAGNVYEWTKDWYEAYEGNEAVTKDYGQVYRVLRGGSYETDKFSARCARRHFDRMDSTRADYGFRCAMDILP